MEPRKRNHVCKRRKWEEIRPIFTELYHFQKKKLSDIVEILGEQGFHAKEHHYKTQIRKWRLDKKNKQSDMIFALQKLRQRQGKDTAFLIRGQARSSEEVEHYWKRSRDDPARFSPVPKTPDGMEYGTPSPCPGRETGEAGSQVPAQDDADSSPFVEDEDVAAVFQYIKRDWIRAPRTTILRLLDSPEHLRPLDQALHHAKMVFQSHVEFANSDLRLVSGRVGIGALIRFMNLAENALVAMQYGLSHTIVTTVLLDMLESIPHVGKCNFMDATVRFLYVIAGYAIGGQMRASRLIRTAQCEIVNRVGHVYGDDHPVPVILRAAIRSWEDTAATSEMVLAAGKDILGRHLGHDHNDMEEVLGSLCDVARMSGDVNASLKHANELYQMTLWRHRRDMTQASLLAVLDSQVQLARLHALSDDFEEADRWIEVGLRGCSEVKDTPTREWFEASFIYYRGLTMEKSGQWSAAFETFNKVIYLMMRRYGPTDHLVTLAAQQMRWIQSHLAEQAQSLSATEGDYHSGRREDPWIAGQEESGIDRQSQSLGDGEVLPFTPETALPSEDGGSHLYTNQPSTQPWTTGHVEEWTDERMEDQWDSQVPEPQAEEGHSWMAWTNDDGVEWTG
ncbi:uncharacterized protein Z520_10548 [Fonsecaea multimorphosa CBS 102226]|uniref:Clr5 domain-containing protein n=1 Tax=Fonsecaea multimorphosa CBS 102226 TaxID=1442371 RepID=A0A0D2JK58_9EURO|nr:uncharacterized protein Z520_10548 [Fonsecaea multimorphosa CBS 102226]KIX93642.1 hypothetical protein Z520_10548 [Fonsecaea multimorphosa CBS 102226]OAL19756.1 hypothetical protein AYO22_09283 [Fonsecaea multimorphosa]